MNTWADDTEQRILDAALLLAPEMGWGGPMTERAARRAGLTPAEAQLLLPHGARDLAALLSRRHDAAVLAALGDASGLKIRERIRLGVTTRLDVAFGDEPALRRWAGFLSLPTNLTLALRLVWETADMIWRWAGDVATDENHYSKRAILSGILVSCLVQRLTRGEAAAQEELARRIDNVMSFEKWKAGKKGPVAYATEMAALLGRLRYR